MTVRQNLLLRSPTAALRSSDNPQSACVPSWDRNSLSQSGQVLSCALRKALKRLSLASFCLRPLSWIKSFLCFDLSHDCTDCDQQLHLRVSLLTSILRSSYALFPARVCHLPVYSDQFLADCRLTAFIFLMYSLFLSFPILQRIFAHLCNNIS